MHEDWKSYLWMAFLALCASTVRWPDLLRGQSGKAKFGLIVLQVPVCIATGALGYGAAQIALHWLPWAGSGLQVVFTSLLAFAGPLFIADAMNKVADGVKRRIGGTND